MKKLIGVLAVMFLVGCIPPRYYSASQVLVVEYSVGYDYYGYGYGYVSSRYYNPYYNYYSPARRDVIHIHNYVLRTSSRNPKHSNEVKPTAYRKRQPVVRSRVASQVRLQPQRRRSSGRRN